MLVFAIGRLGVPHCKGLVCINMKMAEAGQVCDLYGEESIAKVTQARDDVVFLIKPLVDEGGDDV